MFLVFVFSLSCIHFHLISKQNIFISFYAALNKAKKYSDMPSTQNINEMFRNITFMKSSWNKQTKEILPKVLS